MLDIGLSLQCYDLMVLFQICITSELVLTFETIQE